MRKTHPITGHEGPEGKQNYRSTLSLTSTQDGGWVFKATPRPLNPQERDSLIHSLTVALETLAGFWPHQPASSILFCCSLN